MQDGAILVDFVDLEVGVSGSISTKTYWLLHQDSVFYRLRTSPCQAFVFGATRSVMPRILSTLRPLRWKLCGWPAIFEMGCLPLIEKCNLRSQFLIRCRVVNSIGEVTLSRELRRLEVHSFLPT